MIQQLPPVAQAQLPCETVVFKTMSYFAYSKSPLRKHRYPVRPSFFVPLLVPATGGAGGTTALAAIPCLGYRSSVAMGCPFPESVEGVSAEVRIRKPGPMCSTVAYRWVVHGPEQIRTAMQCGTAQPRTCVSPLQCTLACAYAHSHCGRSYAHEGPQPHTHACITGQTPLTPEEVQGVSSRALGGCCAWSIGPNLYIPSNLVRNFF